MRWGRREGGTEVRGDTLQKPYECHLKVRDDAGNEVPCTKVRREGEGEGGRRPGCRRECLQSYTDPSSLRKHIKTVHGDDEYEKVKKNRPPNHVQREYGGRKGRD